MVLTLLHRMFVLAASLSGAVMRVMRENSAFSNGLSDRAFAQAVTEAEQASVDWDAVRDAQFSAASSVWHEVRCSEHRAHTH